MEEIFVNWEDFENLELEYDLEDCGMSGTYPGYHWYQDDNKSVAVYVKECN